MPDISMYDWVNPSVEITLAGKKLLARKVGAGLLLARCSAALVSERIEAARQACSAFDERSGADAAVTIINAAAAAMFKACGMLAPSEQSAFLNREVGHITAMSKDALARAGGSEKAAFMLKALASLPQGTAMDEAGYDYMKTRKGASISLLAALENDQPGITLAQVSALMDATPLPELVLCINLVTG